MHIFWQWLNLNTKWNIKKMSEFTDTVIEKRRSWHLDKWHFVNHFDDFPMQLFITTIWLSNNIKLLPNLCWLHGQVWSSIFPPSLPQSYWHTTCSISNITPKIDTELCFCLLYFLGRSFEIIHVVKIAQYGYSPLFFWPENILIFHLIIVNKMF